MKTEIHILAKEEMTGASPLESFGDRVLSRGTARQRYTLRLAASQADVRAAQALRFNVFNLELKEGLNSSFATGL